MPSPAVASPKLQARRGAQIVYNKAAVDALYAGMADGLVLIGNSIIDDASEHAPRDPEKAAERGVPMMADTGTLSVWALGKLVVGGTEKAAAKYKPRVRTGTKTTTAGQERGTYRTMAVPKNQAVLFVGFASPISHFAELGTIKERARPFLLPAFNRALPGAEAVLIPAMGKRVRAVR